MFFSRKRVPLINTYSLNGSLLRHVSCIKDLKFYLTPTLFFDHHINTTIGRALKILGFIKCNNTTLFTPIICLRSLYFSLEKSIVSILEYNIVKWQPYLAKDQLCIERVQKWFFSYVDSVLKIPHPLHDYSYIS